MTELELMHYGILGMKWGVRRYQNKDGTLTNAGKKRLQKIADRATGQESERSKQTSVEFERRDETVRRKAGIRSTDDSDTDIIEKGSKIYRVANSGESLDGKRKYVSILDNDREAYEDMWDMLNMDYSKPISYYTYESTKKMRVATGKKVVDHLIEKYGDTTYSQFIKDRNLAESIRTAELDYNTGKVRKYLSKKDEKWLESFKDSAYDKTEKFIRDNLKNNMDDIVKDFKSKGYDAIIDAEDLGFTNYPVIILEPNKSLKLKKETKR